MATTSNRVPVFAVRFDDGRENLKDDILPFLYYKIPVTLALHYDLLDNLDVARSSVRDIQDIIDMAGEYGAPIEITQHYNDNFGSTADYASLKKAIDPSRLENAFGVKVRGIAAPGGTTPILVQDRLRAMIREIAEGFGIDWCDYGYPEGAGSLVPPGWRPSVVAWDTLDATAPVLGTSSRLYFPGCMPDGFTAPVTTNIDIGNCVVERDVSLYLNSLPAELKTRTTWTTDYDLVGAGGSINDYAKCWRTVYDAAIADGVGIVVGLHEEDDGTNYGASPADELNGMSYLHIAWTLRQLEDEGFVRLGTQSDLVDWGRCKWEPGTELLPSTQGRIPSRVIGDTYGIDTIRFEGFGSFGVGGTWTTAGSILSFGGSAGTLASPTPEEQGNQPGPWDRPGCINLLASGAAKCQFYKTNLHEGVYELTMHFNDHLIGIEELGVAQMYPRMNTDKAYLDQDANISWLIQSLWQQDGAAGWADSHPETGEPRSCTFQFAIDSSQVPQLLGDLQAGAGTMDTEYPLPIVYGGVTTQITTGGVGAKSLYFSLRYLGPIGG